MPDSSEFSLAIEKLGTNVTAFKEKKNFNRTDHQAQFSSRKKIHQFFKEKIESSSNHLIKKLYESWSMFCILDIHFYQRMTLNILGLQNKEMRALNLSKNYSLPAVELRNQGGDSVQRQQKFIELWKDLDRKFKENCK